MACKNGHDTINDVGNCYTCGEPNDGAPIDSQKVDQPPAPPAAPMPAILSVDLLKSLLKEVVYVKEALEGAIALAEKDG